MAGPAVTKSRPGPAVFLRIVAHAIAEVPVIVVAAIQISKGWVPTSDDAVIAWRTWDVFSGPVPLDGQFTQISAAGHHAAFDLGPLQYYLLALPERIDPVHGLLWGAALVIVALAALAIEAAWAGSGPVGGVVAALGLALITATLVQSTVNLAWNPSIGVYAFTATLAIGTAVARGRFSWLPVAVGSGSLAMQSHMSFVLPTLAVLAVAIALGVLESKRLALGSFAVAVLVGLACFLGPFIQQLTGHPGNMSVLATNLGHLGPKVGFGWGLKGIASATSLPPSWWVHVPALTSIPDFQLFDHGLYDHSELWGIVSLVLCATIAVAAWLTGRRSLAALGAISAGAGLAAAYTLGSVPTAQFGYLYYYLYFVLWPIGMAMVATFAFAIASVAGELARLAGGRQKITIRRRPFAWTVAATVLLAGIGGALVANDVGYGSSPLFLMGWQQVHMVSAVVPAAERVVNEKDGARRPFVVVVPGADSYVKAAIEESVAYELAARGYPARVQGDAEEPLGPSYGSGPGEPKLSLVTQADGRLAARWTPAVRHGP